MQLKNFLLHFSFYKAKNATLQKQKFYIKMLLKNFYYIFSFFEILFGSFKYQSIFLIISLWDFILSCSSLNSLNTLILKGLLDCSDYTRSISQAAQDPLETLYLVAPFCTLDASSSSYIGEEKAGVELCSGWRFLWMLGWGKYILPMGWIWIFRGQ